MVERVYGFDTNIISGLFHSKKQTLLKRIALNETDTLVLCQPVIYEVERGLKHKQAEKQLARFRAEIFPLFSTVAVQLSDWRAAAVFWAYTRSHGYQLSDVDLLLAAMTIRLHGILVTDDADFAYIPTLQTENWLLDDAE